MQADETTEDAGKTLQCEEVWGGNRRVDRRVVLPGLDGRIFSQPCDHEAAGGDVHYVSACAGWQLVRILVADVSGHGPAVADTAEALRSIMRELVNDHDQQRLVQRLNRDFALAAAGMKASDGITPAEFRFATAVALTYDSQTRRLLAVNAGHPPPLWYRVARQEWTTLEPAELSEGRNLPVGVLDGIVYEQFETELALGDRILCYTDSLVEARDASGQMLGTEGLLDLVRRADASHPTANLIAAVVDALEQFNPRNLTQDDLTCLLLRVTPPGPPPSA